MTFTIPFPPVTKKNSQQIWHNRKTGKPFVAQSKRYIQYENDVCKSLPPVLRLKIAYPINLAAVYYMPSKRRVDLVNLIEALQDVLVKANVLEDDNSEIVVSTDGSRVKHDKLRPRTEIIITRVQNE
jgi:Holliday junction resolvase RusA-like endonuclease